MTRGEEQKLIARAAKGDRAAAEVFIRTHQQSLYAYMLRMSGRPEVAEDIVQEAFVRVLTNLDRFDSRYRFSTWLFTIAKRLYLNVRQKHTPSFDSEAIDLWHTSDGRSASGGGAGRGGGAARPEAVALRDERQCAARDLVQHALMALPDDQREIVVLFHQLEWPIAVIAQHMDMPEGTIKSHLHRGRGRMREILEGSERSAERVREVWS
jgi:RNA polymerase sigma-70 factor, ECF subfamily